MHPLFKILTSDIQSLDDEQARELVARLCRAELRRQGIPESSVTWGGNQRAKDGGVDVDVAAPPSQTVTGLVPTCHTVFQVKAEKFPPSKLESEMAPKGVLRPAILALQEQNGTYIVVSTKDDPSHGALRDRITEMKRVLGAHGVSVEIGFYGARVVADWAEQFPAIVIWIRQMLGKSIHGWRPYGAWAYREDCADAPYLLDEEVRLFTYGGSEGLSALQAIEQLRNDLLSYQTIRIVGLSGVGKTRLVQALFDARLVTPTAVPNADSVVYADLSDGLDPQPRQMLESLTQYDVPSILIVDNCGSDLHGRLAEAKSKSQARLGLVTIEYDVQDDLPDDTNAYRLEGSSDAIIKQILSRQFNVLSESDIEVIAEFSDGNARVALALASTVEKTNEVAQLKDRQLFERLFFQGNGKDDNLLRVGEVASLLYSFDGEDTSSDSELALLASLAELTVPAFLRQMQALRARGLVQSRSIWRALLPHAIANRLAIQALSAMPTELIIAQLFTEATDRIARSFSRRLGFLHESDTAQKIVEEWFSETGRLGHPEQLNELGRQVLMNVAPVHPAACLEAVERAVLCHEFIDPDNRSRGDFARVLKAIAYETAYFDRAVEALCQIALADDIKGHLYNVTDKLKQLFFCSLSGTLAAPAQREKVLRALLASGDPGRARIGQILLDATLTTSLFSTDDGPKFGGRARGLGWEPNHDAGVIEWFGTFIELAADIGSGNSSVASACRTILGQQLRGLLVDAGMWEQCLRAAEQLSVVSPWYEGWPSLRAVRQFDLMGLEESETVRLAALEAILKPVSLQQQIEVRLFSADPYLIDLDDTPSTDDATSVQTRMLAADEQARALGRQVAEDPALLSQCIDKLLRSNKFGSATARFGEGVASLTSLEHRKIVERCRDHLRAHGSLGQAFQFLSGFVLGWLQSCPQEAQAWLDDCFCDETWHDQLVSLINFFPPGTQRAARLMRSLEIGKTPALEYSYVAIRWQQSFSVEELFSLFDNIRSLEHGLHSVLSNFNVVASSAEENSDEVNLEVSTRILAFFSKDVVPELLGTIQNNNVHELKRTFAYSLSHIRDFSTAEGILSSVIAYGDEPGQGHQTRGAIGVLIAAYADRFPTETLDALWADGPARAVQRVGMLRKRSLDKKETTLHAISEAMFLAWCDGEPNSRYPYAAMTCKLFESVTQKPESNLDVVSDAQLQFSRLAVSLFRRAPDKAAVIQAFMERFFPSGWTGSLVPTLRARLRMLDELYQYAEAEDRRSLDQARARLQAAVEQAAESEASEERARNATFE